MRRDPLVSRGLVFNFCFKGETTEQPGTTFFQKVQKEIILIDGYVDVDTLNILAKKNAGVEVKIYTYASAQLTNRDAANFNAQYPTLTVKKTQVFHDRFIILDGKTAYHIDGSGGCCRFVELAENGLKGDWINDK